jgi:hypothetical protein
MLRIKSLAAPAFLLLASMAASAQSLESVAFRMPITPTLENPPVMTDASGVAHVTIHVLRDVDGKATAAYFDYDIQLTTGQAETFTAMHIHKALPGSNGPVVIDGAFGARQSPTPGEPFRVFRQVKVESATQLATVEDILKNPHAYYFNIHSVSAPGGILRGHLQRVEASTLSSLESKVAALTSELAGVKDLIVLLAVKQGIIAYPGK